MANVEPQQAPASFRGRVLRGVVLGLASAVVAGNVAAGFLLAHAVPYLPLADVWLAPLVGAAYGAVAGLVALAPRRPGFWALLVIGGGLASVALSLGLAQRSGWWVAAALPAWWLPPAVLALACVALRGDVTGRGPRVVLAATAVAGSAASAAQLLTYNPAGWGWCRCATNLFAVEVSADTYQHVATWSSVAYAVSVLVAAATVVAAFVRRPGRLGVSEITLTAGVVTWAVLATTASLWPVVAFGAPQWVARGAGVALLCVLAGFVPSALRRRPSRAYVADLLLTAREESDPGRFRELVGRAIGQRDAAVLWWDIEYAGYRDHHGVLVDADLIDTTPSRVLRVDTDGHPIALVLTQHALPEDPTVLEPVAEALRLATENRRLAEELQVTLGEVRESRARIVTASDEARKRIERDLHDGAQQLLISTGVKLNLLSNQAESTGDQALVGAVAEVTDELGKALGELRQLAGGITPTALVHGTLSDALGELALRCPVPTLVDVTGEVPAAAALDSEAASSAYFVVAECLTNVAKHAEATSTRVAVEFGQPTRVTVSDDGRGGADPASGTGLEGLADRLEARGGTLKVVSSSGGTSVVATIPLPAQDSRS